MYPLVYLSRCRVSCGVLRIMRRKRCLSYMLFVWSSPACKTGGCALLCLLPATQTLGAAYAYRCSRFKWDFLRYRLPTNIDHVLAYLVLLPPSIVWYALCKASSRTHQLSFGRWNPMVIKRLGLPRMRLWGWELQISPSLYRQSMEYLLA